MAIYTMTPKEYAKLWGYHINTVYYWIRRGLIEAEKIQVHVRYHYRIPFDAPVPCLKSGPKGGISLPKLVTSTHRKHGKSG